MEGIQLEKLGNLMDWSMDWGKSRPLTYFRSINLCEFLAEKKSINSITEILLLNTSHTDIT